MKACYWFRVHTLTKDCFCLHCPAFPSGIHYKGKLQMFGLLSGFRVKNKDIEVNHKERLLSTDRIYLLPEGPVIISYFWISYHNSRNSIKVSITRINMFKANIWGLPLAAEMEYQGLDLLSFLKQPKKWTQIKGENPASYAWGSFLNHS